MTYCQRFDMSTITMMVDYYEKLTTNESWIYSMTNL